MNVLVLTPIAVGSTLLQRVLTLVMQEMNFSKPVINTHELTNGLITYHNPHFGMDVIGKPKPKEEGWLTHLTLPQIVDMLSSVDHFKVSRVASVSLFQRNDSKEDLSTFYEYLNKNFFIIQCKRENIFEYALSWALRNATNQPSVYTPEQRIRKFSSIYENPIHVDTASIVKSLEDYNSYLSWCEEYFTVSSEFVYERDSIKIDDYISTLPFSDHHVPSWKSIYGESFDNWNRLQYLQSDIPLPHQEQKLLGYDTFECNKNALIKGIANELIIHDSVNSSISEMVTNKIIPTRPPIKKHTLLEKIYLIKNLQECLDTYNQWIISRPHLGSAMNVQDLRDMVEKELGYWLPDPRILLD